jgi:hypothetical protein
MAMEKGKGGQGFNDSEAVGEIAMNNSSNWLSSKRFACECIERKL